MKIVLLGYMGSGKSTIGKLLATELDSKFVDLDAYIENAEDMSIPQIFERKGEIYFRRKESEYVSKVLAERDNIILSLGGGTPCYGNNMKDVLGFTENVVYLKTSVMELSKRLLKEKNSRPLIKDIPDGDLPEFIGKHLFERSFYYQKAKIVIDCDGKAIEIIVSEIKGALV